MSRRQSQIEMSIRLQKLLAQSGLGSRRQLEKLIAAGKITVNGSTAKLGDKASHSDKIHVDNQRIKLTIPQPAKARVLLYNKPEGELCSRSDPMQRDTVFNALPSVAEGRWIIVGRLDLNSSGLLLFTTDGELAHRLMHPRYQFEREYAVRVLGRVDQKILAQLQAGVMLAGRRAKFERISFVGGTGANRWYRVTIREGRNREVRNLWQTQGITVSRLMRIRFANISLPKDLRVRQHRELSPGEVAALQSLS